MKEMRYWAKVIKKLSNDKSLKRGFVPANNHYVGFGPATANEFRGMLGMKQAVWDEMKQATLD